MMILPDETNIQRTETMIDNDSLTMNESLLDKSEFLMQRRAYRLEFDLLQREPNRTGETILYRILKQLPNLREVQIISTDQIGSKNVLDAFPEYAALQFTHTGVETLPQFLKVAGSWIRHLDTIRIFDQDDPQWFTSGPSVRTSRPGPDRTIRDQHLDFGAIAAGMENLADRYHDNHGLDHLTTSIWLSTHPFLLKLKTLEIYGRKSHASSFSRFCDALRRVLVMPSVIANIERLAIGCEETEVRVDNLQEVFGSTHFPKLRHLGLQWWFSPDPLYMANLLIRHRATLQRLYFHKVVAGEGTGRQGYCKDWNMVFDLLRGKDFPRLQQFDLNIPTRDVPGPESLVSVTAYVLRQQDDSPIKEDSPDASE